MGEKMSLDNEIFIKNVNNVLELNLDIPNYQRPYKWEIKNMSELLYDIENAIELKSKYGEEYKYRIGTIILHKNKKYDIVDGQQRLISMILIKKYLDHNYECELLNNNFINKITIQNIKRNYEFVVDWFKNKDENLKNMFIEAYSNILELVVIIVNDISEAFQLFDSQNTRGKALEPHDLLKAYHLRAMKDFPNEMERAVKKWESNNSVQIKNLFNLYLFRIYNWSKGSKCNEFTIKDIDIYKGIEESSSYAYAKRAYKASPHFQITEPYISGNDFFEMVDYYLYIKDSIEKILKSKKFEKIYNIINNKDYKNSSGFNYSVDLFKCCLMFYYDKFRNFNEDIVIKLFTWAFMIRVDMENLQFESINKYAIGGEDNNYYTNHISMFEIIKYSRLHFEIANIQIQITRENDKARVSRWQNLYEDLKNLNNLGDKNGRK